MQLDVSLAAAAVVGVFLCLHGVRAFGAEDLKPHQQRMRTCNTQAQAKGLAAGERNKFMRDCLKGGNGNGKKLSAHQRRNQDCNREAKAKGLEGSERRGFMSECEKPPVKQRTAEKEKMKSCARRADQRRLSGEERSRYLSGCRNAVTAAARPSN
jgi:hypothetical protein